MLHIGSRVTAIYNLSVESTESHTNLSSLRKIQNLLSNLTKLTRVKQGSTAGIYCCTTLTGPETAFSILRAKEHRELASYKGCA